MKHPFLLLLAALVALAGCGTAPPKTKQAVPRIGIAPDGRTFVTETGHSWLPMGVNYFRPGTGWAPQVWKRFDSNAIRSDFALMQRMGVNCVRVFLSYGSFCEADGSLKSEGARKLDDFLLLAEEAGIYVHPTGPDHWEGPAPWGSAAIEDTRSLEALERFWTQLAARYRGRNALFAYDLRNEPEVGWSGPVLESRWNTWLKEKYGDGEKLRSAWAREIVPDFGSLPLPGEREALNDPELRDFQAFRESLADEWTRRQVAAIKAADPAALVTVGLIQWSVPALLPAGPRHYSGFRPARQARWLDFLEVHFYPLARGVHEYRNEEEELANLAYLESVVREVARPGKPVVLAEFGWYGGGRPRFDRGKHPFATEEQQAQYCRRVVKTSAPYVTGWLNWGLYDHPEAQDCTEFTGLLTASGAPKEWGRVFSELSARLRKRRTDVRPPGPRPDLNWDACLTSRKAGDEFLKHYFEAFIKEKN